MNARSDVGVGLRLRGYGLIYFFFFSSRRRHTRWTGDWSSDVCSSDLTTEVESQHLTSSAAAFAPNTPPADTRRPGRVSAPDDGQSNQVSVVAGQTPIEGDRKSVV